MDQQSLGYIVGAVVLAGIGVFIWLRNRNNPPPSSGGGGGNSPFKPNN